MSVATTFPQTMFGPSFDRLFDEALFGGPFRNVWARAAGAPAVQPMPLDVYATPNEAVILAAAPGMRPDSLDITVQQNTVTLSGTVQDVAQSEEAKQATWYLHELWSGQYRRSVTLPFEVDAAKAHASFESGIVRIVLPKAEHARPKKIAISTAPAQTAIGSGQQNGTRS
jgi:HSP20 family protein